MSSSLQKLLLSSLILMLSTMLAAVEISSTTVSNSNLLEDRDILAEYDGGQILREDIMAKIAWSWYMYRSYKIISST